MKIVFDTNVLISAFLTAAGCSQYVFSRALKKHSVILSPYILREFQEKLTGKLRVPKPLVQEALDLMRRRAQVVDFQAAKPLVFRDKKDIPILMLASWCEAHYLITGDRAMLELKKHGTCLIVSPREAMEFL